DSILQGFFPKLSLPSTGQPERQLLAVAGQGGPEGLRSRSRWCDRLALSCYSARVRRKRQGPNAGTLAADGKGQLFPIRGKSEVRIAPRAHGQALRTPDDG